MVAVQPSMGHACKVEASGRAHQSLCPLLPSGRRSAVSRRHTNGLKRRMTASHSPIRRAGNLVVGSGPVGTLPADNFLRQLLRGLRRA